jgi:hypothetical protein
VAAAAAASFLAASTMLRRQDSGRRERGVGKGARVSSCREEIERGRKMGGSSDGVSFYTNMAGRQWRGAGSEGSHAAARSGGGAWGASTEVGRRGVAGTSPEPTGAGGWAARPGAKQRRQGWLPGGAPASNRRQGLKLI